MSGFNLVELYNEIIPTDDGIIRRGNIYQLAEVNADLAFDLGVLGAVLIRKNLITKTMKEWSTDESIAGDMFYLVPKIKQYIKETGYILQK